MEKAHKSKHDVRDFRKVWDKTHPEQEKLFNSTQLKEK